MLLEMKNKAVDISKPELLLPAGTYENAETAFRYGADAIYQGLSGFSLRSGKKAEVDFTSLEKSLALAKQLNKTITWHSTYLLIMRISIV